MDDFDGGRYGDLLSGDRYFCPRSPDPEGGRVDVRVCRRGVDRNNPDDLDEVAVLNPPDGESPRLLFLKVPEGKAVKNRWHLDLRPQSTMAVEVARLTGLGARLVRVFEDDGEDVFTVMQDPEGNEFCVERGPGDRGPDAT